MSPASLLGVSVVVVPDLHEIAPTSSSRAIHQSIFDRIDMAMPKLMMPPSYEKYRVRELPSTIPGHTTTGEIWVVEEKHILPTPSPAETPEIRWARHTRTSSEIEARLELERIAHGCTGVEWAQYLLGLHTARKGF